MEERRLLTVNLLPSVPVWQALGPDPIQDAGLADPGTSDSATNPHTAVGAIESVVTVPTGSTYTVYAGTVNGGVWRADGVTTSNLATLNNWIPLTDHEPSLAVSSMALDPTDPTGNTLWIGTGSLSSLGELGGSTMGLLKTTDGGQT